MGMAKQQVLVTGSVAYDRIMNFPGYFKDQILPDKIHILNVSFFVQALKESFGGTAGNIAYSLSLLGIRPTIGARVGAKDFGPYQKWMRKNHFDMSVLQIIKNEQTASAYIITDKSDNQIAGFFPGAMLQPFYSKFKIQNSKFGLAIVSPQNPVDMVKLPEMFKKKKVPYIFDPGQQTASLSGPQLRDAITRSEVLIGNDYEIALITKKTGWDAKKLLKKSKTVITTFGEKGSTITSGDKVWKIPVVKPKKVLDPTGAGDAYRAGIIFGMTKNWDWAKTSRLAATVAAYTVETYGTQSHHFATGDLKRRYRQNFKEDL